MDIAGQGQDFVLSNLPAGQYLLSAKAEFKSGGSLPVVVQCSLSVDGTGEDSSSVTLPIGALDTIPLAGAETLFGGENVVLHCATDHPETSTLAEFIKLSAIQVGSLSLTIQ